MKKPQWREKLVTSLEFPRDLVMNDTIVTVTGRTQISVENYRSILCYTTGEVRIRMCRGCLCIRGRELQILSCSPEEMQIRGSVSEIVFTN